MKALKGTAITCSACMCVAGSFRRLVTDSSPITTDDVDVDVSR